MVIYCQINVPLIVLPTLHKRNIVQGQAIIDTTKHIEEIMGSKYLERNTNHGMEQAMDFFLNILTNSYECTLDSPPRS